MQKKDLVFKLAGILCVFIFITLMLTSDVPAQGTIGPKLNRNACIAACVLDQNIVHSNQGLSGPNMFHYWYKTYWHLTGCGESGWKTDLKFLFSVVSDALGAPGGVTMNCWQALAGQGAVCSQLCRDYGIKDGAYAPNVRVSSISTGPGYHQVRVDNYGDYGLDELNPNAYSRNFYLKSTLQLNGGQPLMVNAAYLPSLGFPNWITNNGLSGYSNCVNAYSNDNRCNLLMPFASTDMIDWSVNYYDGVLYDLSSFVSKSSGVSGSFANNGFIVLKSNGNSVTLKRGDYTGVVWRRIFYQDKGPEDHFVEYWNGNQGDITITNHECNNKYICLGDQLAPLFSNPPWVDVDTYVFAVQGPSDLRLPGIYTLTVLADVGHDKDYSNNIITYSYTDQDLEDWDDPTGGGDDPIEPIIDISTLPVVVIPGEGEFNYTLPSGEPGMMFRLDVPLDISSMNLEIFPTSHGKVWAYGNLDSIPVPSYPATWSYEYTCMVESAYQEIYFPSNCGAPGNHQFFLFVEGISTAKSFRIEVEFVTNLAATATAQYHQTRQVEYALTQQALIRTFTEVEPNNSRETANQWDMVEPFTGELYTGDDDYIAVTFTEPGIYTFGITEVSPEIRVFLGLIYRPGGFIETASSIKAGEGVSLTFDASAGERFYFKVNAVSRGAYQQESQEPYYTLELLDFIPDPFEPNDSKTTATDWQISQGPIEGYFWEIGNFDPERADYYRFIAPATTDGSAVTFQVTNPEVNLSIGMTLKDHNGSTIQTVYSERGQGVSLIYTLVPGQDYYIKLFSLNSGTSPQPYSLQAEYLGSGSETGLSEVEPNNSCQTANPWDMLEPFRGVLSTSPDRDYILIDIPTPGIYTFSITDVSPNLKVGLYLVSTSTGGGAIHTVHAQTKGQDVSLIMDGSAGEQYCLVVYALQWGSDGSGYRLRLTDFIPDPGEPNDHRTEATYWVIDEGPIQGYFWEKTRWGMFRADFIKFMAPLTAGDSPVTFLVTNPGSDISICMNLLNHTGSTLLSGQCAPQGENASMTTTLTAGMDYYLKLFTVNNNGSLLPYTLSIDYAPGEAGGDLDDGTRIRLHGFVHKQWGVLPLPMANVPIYAHISGQPAFLLGTTNWLGTYSARVMLADGQQVNIWPELPGSTFLPDMDGVLVESGLRQHRSVFMVVGGQMVQQTPTPDPQATDTPQPPFAMLTDTHTPDPGVAGEGSTGTPTVTPTFSSTPSPTSTDTPQPAEETSTTILGMVWRLFQSGPAGVAAAEVTLSVNGVDRQVVISRIDGLYLMEVEGIQPGDVLRLRAQAAQDGFEPIYYEWVAERGVNRWEYDFYAYWEQIASPTSMDQNRIWGTVWDQFGADVSGLYLNVQVGTSDAIQRIGPTDEDGYFEGLVTLPDRIMVTVWVDAEGYLPSKLIFFHPYEPENRELIFWKYYGENLQ